MAKYRASIPNSANSFDFNGDTYGGGSAFESDNPCQMLDFARAFQAANPDRGRQDDSPDFWQSMEAACPAGDGGTPVDTPDSAPVESEPDHTDGDSATDQGAPEPVGSGTDGGVSLPDETDDPPVPGEEPHRPPEGEEEPTLSSEQPRVTTDAGDPVDIFTGAFYVEETDLEVPNTLLPLSFKRNYRSGRPAFGPLGWNWDHNYNLYIRELNNGNIALWRRLHEDIFTFDGAAFQPPPGIFEKLEPVVGLAQTYEISGDGGTVMRFERPLGWVDGERIPLVRISDRHANALRFTYGAEDKLAEVRDDNNRFLHFDYDACGLLVAASDHSGRRYVYEHDEQTAQLVGATSPATADHPDGVTRIYHYEDPFLPPELRHNIVRVEDSEGNVYLENAYDEDPASLSFARISEQLYGGFLFQFRYTQLQFVPADAVFINVAALRVEVMNPDFGMETYTFNYRGDLLDRRYRLNKDASFRVVAIQYRFDDQGNLTGTTKPDGSEELLTYDNANADPRMRGKLLQRELTAASGFPAPSRIVWRGRYEPQYQLLIEERSENAAVTAYKYDFDLAPGAATNSGKLKQILHPDATLPDGTIQSAVTTFEHNAKGQITAVVMPDGVRNEMVYGTAGNGSSRLVQHVFDMAGLDIVNDVDYDGFGFDSTRIDGNGETTTRSINAIGLVERETLPAVNGATTEYVFHYNADRKLVGVERPSGQYMDAAMTGPVIVDTFERNVLGYPVAIALSTNTVETRTVRSCYDYRGFAVRTVNPDGSRVVRTIDERGLLVEDAIEGADGARVSKRSVYDRSGNLRREVATSGATREYEYDGFARVSKRTEANGTELRYTWLSGDLLGSIEAVGDDGLGNVRRLSRISYGYDEKSRRTTETVESFEDNPAAAVAVTTTYFYDTWDRVVRTVDSRGGATTSQYDGVGRLTVTTDPMGNEERFTYDANGNLIQTDSHHQEPDGTVSVITKQYTYDARNRRSSAVEPGGSTIALDYDNRDLLVRVTDYLGRVKTVEYNSFGNRTAETYDVTGLAIAHRWTLDVMSRPASYVDPTGQVSTYAVDGVGRLVATHYPNGQSTARIYDAAGNVGSEQLGNGVRFEYTYDAANRLTRIRNSATPASIVAVPDHVFSYDGLDRLVFAEAGADQVARWYDSRGRLIAEDTLGTTIECAHDDATGAMLKTWPDGRAERYTRDLNGNTTRIEESVHGALGSGMNVLADFIPSGPAFVGEGTYPGNLTVTAKYDDRKRLVEIAASSPAGIADAMRYRYDTANRNRIETTDGQNPVFRYFEFDRKYRLTSSKEGFAVALPAVVTQADHDTAVAAAAAAAAAATHQEGFDYNAADDRLTYTETGQPTRNYTYFPGHQVRSDGIDGFTHSGDGTMASDGHFTYQADALGRIVSVRSGVNVACALEYDALGRPSVVREAARPVRSFNYFGPLVVQENDNGVAVRQHTPHPTTGLPIAYHAAGATHYTLFDARRNLVALTDTNGALLENYRYKPFGVPSIIDPAGALLPASPFGVEPVFGGTRFLPSTNLYLAKRRLMNPVHGLFLSPDPRGYANSASLYVYAAQNPIDLVDPDGEFAFLAILAVMAVGALIAGGIDAVHQGIQIAEDPRKRKEGFSWSELGLSMGFGAVAAPILVVAPELAVPLAAWGVYNGVDQIAQGNYATGTFDIATSLLPFASKSVRGATFGRGSYIGQVRGLGPQASWATRTGRFALIDNSLRNFFPSPFGRRVGLGFTGGHTAVIIENESGGLWFVEKNGRRDASGLWARFGEADTPPANYDGRPVPFEYESLRVPESSAEEAMSYARDRLAADAQTPEPFDFRCANCSHFAGDVLGRGGFRGMGNGRATGLWSDFTNFGLARDMTYSTPFWAKPPALPGSSK